MRGVRLRRMMKSPGARIIPVALDREPPRHAEMHDEALAGRERRDEIFPAARKAVDARALKPSGEPGRQIEAQVIAPSEDALKGCAFHRRRKTPTHGFDFGKFRHGASLFPIDARVQPMKS